MSWGQGVLCGVFCDPFLIVKFHRINPSLSTKDFCDQIGFQDDEIIFKVHG